MADAITYLRNLLMHPGFDVGCLIFNFLFTKYPPLFLHRRQKAQDYLACVASTSCGFGAKNKERESKTAQKMGQVRE